MEFVHVVDDAGLETCLRELEACAEVALDTETAFPRDPVKAAAFRNVYSLIERTGEYAPVDAHTLEVRLVQMKGESTVPYVIDVWALSLAGVERLKGFFRGYAGTFIIFNAKFDLKAIYGSLGVWVDYTARIFCPMQASILLGNSVGMGQYRGHRLVDVSRDFLGVDLDKTEQASDWSKALTAEQLQYAALDVVHLHELKAVFWDALVVKLKQVEPVDLEMRVIGPVARMEWNGVPFSPLVYRKVQEAARYALPELLSKIGEYFADQLGVKRMPQRVQILKADGTYEFKTYLMPYFQGKSGDVLVNAREKVLGLLQQLGLVDDEGEPITDTQRGTLEGYRKEHPGVAALLDYMALFKQTQFDYEVWVHPLTKRLHPTIRPSGASTGRFACNKPNANQVPSKFNMMHPHTGEKLNYRFCFQAEGGKLIVSSDFSSQELGVMFSISGDEVGCNILNAGDDVHAEAAAGMFGIDPKDAKQPIPGLQGVTYRDRGKVCVFSQAYGKTAEGFSKDWKISLEEAKKIVQGFARRFSQLSTWLTRSAEIAAATKVATLVNGAMRFVGGELGRSADAAAKRQGANAQIQGLSAWMTRIAIIDVDRKALHEGMGGIALAVPIHDELLATIDYDQGCAVGVIKAGNDPAFNDLKAKVKQLKDQEGEAEAKAELASYTKAAEARCEAGCGTHCAHRYIEAIGASMKAAGEHYLKGKVPAGFSTACAVYWEH